MNLPIYMDNHATTPVDPRVLEAMIPFFTQKFGNPSSRTHSFGWNAAAAVETARKNVAQIIGAQFGEILFTSGATESDNLAVKGVAALHRGKDAHIITCAIEHKAILDSCKHLESEGVQVTYLSVDRYGMVDPDDVRKAITPRTILISIMLASNEIGTVEPVAEIGHIAREHGILFHTDAAQAVGKIPVDVDAMNIDLLSLTAHKVYGPKGVGALYVRGGQPLAKLQPLIDGGGQESGLRSGTLNVTGIVGLGEACRIAEQEMPSEAARLIRQRDRLQSGILTDLDGVYANGHPQRRLPQNMSLSFAGVDGAILVSAMSDVAVSGGAACSSAAARPSHVLDAIGVPPNLMQSTLRFGLGRFTTDEEVDYAHGCVLEAVRSLRGVPAAADKQI